MAMQKSDRDWALLKNEYNICRKKLESKKEGIRILMKDMEHCQMERDIYKNKVCQLQQELDELKDLVGDHWRDSLKNGSLFSYEENSDKKIKTLTQLIQRIRKENKALHNDLASVKKLYVEAQQDNQLLKETLHQHESRRKESTCDANEKMRLIEQLEETQSKVEELKNDIENLTEEKNEVEQERDHFKGKCTRLNTQLNYTLQNDDRRIVDVDALVLENKYLKEVAKQNKAERAMMVASVTRYKEALDRRFNKANRLLAYLDMPMSLKQRAFGNHGTPVKEANSETVHEMQRLTTSLTESLTDKDTALKIQRKTNKVLGMRVRELEKKLRTLEISGLWSLQEQNVNGALLPANDLPKRDLEKKVSGKEPSHANSDEVEIEAGGEFEDSCWDPYCEKVEDLVEVKDHRFSDTLIDISGCHANNNNGDHVSSLGSFDVNLEYFDDISLPSPSKFKDDLSIESKDEFDLTGKWLRRTKSCPNSRMRTCCKPS